jgi:hypothetical protein
LFAECRVICAIFAWLLLSESCGTSAHDFALTNELGVEFGTVESKVDVEIHSVEGALGCVHALKVLLEILAAEVRGKRDDFLDAWGLLLVTLPVKLDKSFKTYEDPWYIRDKHPRRKRRAHPRT